MKAIEIAKDLANRDIAYKKVTEESKRILKEALKKNESKKPISGGTPTAR